jgi:AraC-like DNA-binding protein
VRKGNVEKDRAAKVRSVDAIQLARPENLLRMFEHLPQIYFYLKDKNSTWVECNAATLSLFNTALKSDVVGKTDRAFYPENIAAEIIADDRSVIRSGEPIIDKLEVIVDERGRLLWVLTTKLPAYDDQGEICGVMGMTRPVASSNMLPDGYRHMVQVIDYVDENYRNPIEVSFLAELAGLSHSYFRKQFSRVFKISPQKFITRIRVQTAAKMLSNGNETIVDIAMKCGFCDQSYFTRQFSSIMGTTPKKYRDRRGTSSAIGVTASN